jgi:hypothetical protein
LVNISRSNPLSWSPALSEKIGVSRREFLRSAAGIGAGTALFSFRPLHALAMPQARKVVVVTFGGGARDEETFAPDGQENIPHILQELIPRATFFTQVVNRGILGHYVANASMATGVYETFDNFAAVAPKNPTIFEYFRRDLRRPIDDAWVIAPSNGFNRIGASSCRGYGSGANVILPKRLLQAALPSDRTVDFAHLLRDNYETPLYTPRVGGSEFDLSQLSDILRVSVQDFVAHARTLASPDELSIYIARRLMQQLAPSLLWITLHDIDIAHSGAYSLYIDGIRRSDRLCGEIWQAIESHPAYAGKTALFILPDFGRDSDLDSAGNGFQHHRTGDALSRTTWLLAAGPGIREGVSINRAVDSLDLVPTLGARLGFSPRFAKGAPLQELI